MQAIILCGGQGTRLRQVIGERQKTMTEVSGEPFVVNILKYIKSYGVDDIIFATGYKSDEVENYFGKDYYFGMRIAYAKEEKPLGTGGAIRNALPYIVNDYVLVLNGDTLFPAEIDLLKEVYDEYHAYLAIACKSIEDKGRYGTIVFNDLKEIKKGISAGVIEKFDEKIENSINEETFINGGVYIISKELIKNIDEDVQVSLEKELIPKWLKEDKLISGIVSDEKFIDIGTPESLQKFKDENE